ncbi:MAG: TrmH family RNA methyltransferase, partial [Fervidobacterium pennivorans]
KPIWQADLKRPLALVFGNEGSGIRQLVKQSCDELVSIPMKTSIDSLNVSVSAGIIIYEVLRREMMNA